MPIGILTVDDHASGWSGNTAIIAGEPEMTIAAGAGDGGVRTPELLGHRRE